MTATAKHTMASISKLKQKVPLSSHVTLAKSSSTSGLSPSLSGQGGGLNSLPLGPASPDTGCLQALHPRGERYQKKVKSLKEQGGQLPDFSMLEVWAPAGAVPRVGDSSGGLVS